jgi:predicted  nucleic acid-binding Zn-ribbon protein
MTDKTRLVEHVKDWLQIDTEIKQLQQEIRKRRKMKKDMTNALVQIMKSQDIDMMNAGESQLIRTEKKTKSALSKKHLITSLLQYFKEDKQNVAQLSTFIMNSRPEKTIENIRRKVVKK